MKAWLGWMVLGLGTRVGTAAAQPAAEAVRWHAEAARVTITRDDWGIAHIHGKTDADAVFGMIYAQCEDDFNRVEMNYLTSLGRVAEAEGEKAVWGDVRQRLFVDPEQLKSEYAQATPWLRKLMDGWADGINFYLATHPGTKAKVLTHFEPWMALSFTEGSIGGDIERVDLRTLEKYYGGQPADKLPVVSQLETEKEPGGSNGIAIAPRLTHDGHALLLINPHTSFFFRSELQMTSDEGLNAYGAVTWGQFFVYQGFNDRVGWMHTSSGVDAVDEYAESPAQGGYLYGTATKKFTAKRITVQFRKDDGSLAEKTILASYSVHGPIVRQEGLHPVAIQLMQRHLAALEQSYSRTRSRSYAEYRKTMELMGNSSNNTVYADADGTIAYWHGDFIPRRDGGFDFNKPVDGSNPATDWHGLLTLDEVPQLKNPASGYLFNVNDSPWNGAGASSLQQKDYPAYVERGIESARGTHAMRVLGGGKDWTVASLRAAAYDSYLPWFARTLPGLLAAWDALPAGDARKPALAGPIGILRAWDDRWSADSTATSLAVFWGTELLRHEGSAARDAHIPSEDWVAGHAAPDALLAALEKAAQTLTQQFGSAAVQWGTINRFQRLTGDIVQPFNDAAPSIPVPFVSSVWGSLASFGARPYPGTKDWYGTSGNSFVAIVEFGPRVRAVAVTAGGESGHPDSKHFDDEAERYAAGNLREVYFYPDQLKGHTQRTYKPGE